MVRRDGLRLTDCQHKILMKIGLLDRWQPIKTINPRTVNKLLRLGLIKAAPFGVNNYRLTKEGWDWYRKFKAATRFNPTKRTELCPRCKKSPKKGKSDYCDECGRNNHHDSYLRKLEMAKHNPLEHEARYGRICCVDGCEEKRHQYKNGVYSSYCRMHKREIQKRNKAARKAKDNGG